jgi:adenylate kinase
MKKRRKCRKLSKHFIIFGPPGSGKGTHSEGLAKAFSIPHISTGDILREHLAKDTELGKKAKAYMDKGEYVPDSVVNALVEARLSQGDCKKGFILDGFPRTIAQAKALNNILTKINLQIDRVINLVVPDEEIINRLSTRRVCKSCGTIYNVVSNPPKKEGVCDKCGGNLIIRDDDKPNVVRNRLKVYTESSKPILDIYKSEGKVVDVNGVGEVETVLSRVKNAVGGKK